MHQDEARDLTRAVRTINRTPSDSELLAWKANRGMLSARTIASKSGQQKWLRAARTVLAVTAP